MTEGREDQSRTTAAGPGRPSERSLVSVPCDHCGGKATRGVHRIPRLVQCRGCGLIYVNPRPSPEAVAAQYDDAYFHAPEPVFGGYEDYEGDRADILRTFRRRLGLLKSAVAGSRPRVLDVGCATGIFLEVAREAGWDAEGIDISAYALSRAREKGLSVRQGSLTSLPLDGARYDAITMWDLFEHVPDPSAVLATCRNLLVPGGVLAITTPDAGSLAAHVLGPRWLGYRSIDEHLYFFSRGSIAAMLTKAGLQVRTFRTVGKYLALPRLIERLRFYTRIGAFLLRTVDRAVPDLSLYVNSGDTMIVLARRPGPNGEVPRA